MLELRGSAAVTGVGETPQTLFSDGVTTVGLAIEASLRAIADAGLSKEEIDGVLLAEPPGWKNPRAHIELSEHLGIYAKRLCMSATHGSASAGFCVDVARWAIAAGGCRHVLVVGAGRLGSATAGPAPSEWDARGLSPSYEHPFGPGSASLHAALARRYMHEHGTAAEQIATVATLAREHGARNPEALFRDPLSVADVLDSPSLATPLHRLECAVAGDGAAALVVSGAAEARELCHPLVSIFGCGSAQAASQLALSGGRGGGDRAREAGAAAAARAFAEAGLGPHELDLLLLSDVSTVEVLVQLDYFGLCERGAAGELVAGGALGPAGSLPLNPHGGLLCGVDAGVGSFRHHVEAVRQLRGDCAERQVEGAAVALASSVGGIGTAHFLTIYGGGERR